MNHQGGKRHYEFLVSVIVISLVSLVFYVWVEKLAIKVEESRIQYMLSNLGSAIKIRELTVIVAGKGDELAVWHHGNPMDFLNTQPPEYAGEIEDSASVPSGSWFFDRQLDQLAYVVISPESNKDRAEQLRYQLQFIDSVQAGRGSLRLVPVPYQAKEAENE
jgi:hypothetical protein